jgi:type VI secretion system Hcp family effector
MAVLMMCSSAFAGGIFITISGNGGQIKTEAEGFRYSKSPSDLAGGSSSMATAGAATSARGAGGGRAAMRRMNEPIVIVHKVDESSPFFVKAAANGETLTSVVIEFKRAVGTGTEVFQTVTLTNAIVSSVKTINGGIQPTEEISFTFQKIAYENKDGAAAAPSSWN